MRKIEIEDFSRIVHVADPQLSSNGEKLALVTVKSNLKDNKYDYEILIYEVKSGDLIYTISSPEGDFSPKWSPSGRKLIFTSRRGFKEEDKGNAIFLTVLAGEPRFIAKKKEGFSEVKFLKENTLIALSPTPIRTIDEDNDYVEIRDIPPWFDKSGFIDEYRRQIYLIDLASGLYKQITSGTNEVEYIAPSNSGDKIAYIRKVDYKNPLITEVRILNIKTGEDYQVIEPKYNFIGVTWSPDDKYLALHGNDLRRGLSTHNHIWIASSEYRSKPENLTGKIDRNTLPAISCDVLGPYRSYSPPQWLEDKIIFLVNSHGKSNLFEVNINGDIKQLTNDNHVIHNFSVSKDGKIALLKTDPETLPEIYIYDYNSGELNKFTNFNDWFKNEIKISKLKYVKVKASDGESIDAWYIEPIEKDGKSKYPAILFVHGGPKSSYGWTINFMHQLMASKGYYVIISNPRGSDGYSEEFADIRGHYGERDYQDIMDVINEIISRISQIDENRLGVTGISYGGFMTNWIVTQTDKFKAAISENGIADWISDFWSSDIGFFFDPDQIGGTPLKNLEKYIKQSPVYFAENVKTPVLLIHSMEDYRCFIDQSLAFHIALRLLGKESRLIVFRKGSHGHSILAKPRHRKKRYEIILKFFNEKLKNKTK